jgi:hypothetical protein
MVSLPCGPPRASSGHRPGRSGDAAWSVTTNVDWNGQSRHGAEPKTPALAVVRMIKRSSAHRERHLRGAWLLPRSPDLEMLDEGTA